MLRATFLCFLVTLQWDFLRAADLSKVEITFNRYPSVAVISHIDDWSICGATIVAKRLVLTAQACVADYEPRNVRVTVGQLLEQQVFTAVKFYKYQLGGEKNDSVSLVEIGSDFKLSQTVKIVDQPYGVTKADMKNLGGSSLLVTDWILNAWELENKQVSGVLDLDVIYTFIGDDAECMKHDRYQNFICTNTAHNVTLKTVGGPILFRNYTTGAVKIVAVVTTNSFLERPLVTTSMKVQAMNEWLNYFLKK